MLEKWPVSTDILNLFATNDAGEVIPPRLIDNMDRASKFGVSGNTQQQLWVLTAAPHAPLPHCVS